MQELPDYVLELERLAEKGYQNEIEDAWRQNRHALLILVRELFEKNKELAEKIDELEEGMAELGERAYL